MRGPKILFRLQQDNDGYPPFAVESIWAVKLPDGNYRLDNIPFFVREATLGDIVSADEIDDGLWFSRVITRSANSLLRVVLFDLSRLDEVCDRLTRLGCEVETAEASNLVAVNLPPTATLAPVQAYLRIESSAGWLDYEEPILRHPG